jgi:hypothetical protein
MYFKTVVQRNTPTHGCKRISVLLTALMALGGGGQKAA